MTRAILVAAFILNVLNISAQEQRELVCDNDTIRYTYTPLAATVTDTIAATAVSMAADSLAVDTTAPKQRNSIFRRLIRYFEQANEDRTQEKLKEKQGVIVRGTKNW